MLIVLDIPPPQRRRPINARIKTTSSIDTRGNSVDPLDLPTLDPEQMAVGHRLIWNGAIQPREPYKDVHGSVLLIDNVAAVGNIDVAGHAADGAGLAGRVVLARVGAAFETRACRAPGDYDALVVEAVEVGVAAGLDHGTRVPLFGGDGVPVLDGVPVKVTCGVEEPVARVGDD